MATAQNSGAWDLSVDERIKLLATTLSENKDLQGKLPGLSSLLDDYLDDGIPVTQQDFFRRILQVFRDSAVDNTFQRLLDEFTSNEREKITKFVDGEPIEEVCRGFRDCGAAGISLGVREHLEKMNEADTVHVSSDGPVHVRGLSMGSLKERDCIFYNFVHEIAELLHIHTDAEKDSVLVSGAVNYKCKI